MGEAKLSASLSRVRVIYLLVYFWLLPVSKLLYGGVVTRVLFFSTYSYFQLIPHIVFAFVLLYSL